jgi:hypothetical protein
MSATTRERLEWGPKEIDEQRKLVAHLKSVIQGAPCLIARPGETTYECRIDSPCRVCQWRHEVNSELVEEWGMPDGIW